MIFEKHIDKIKEVYKKRKDLMLAEMEKNSLQA